MAEVEYKGLDVGYFASPQLVDLNRDGLLDLIIGEQSGTINYCENFGTSNTAVFDTIIEYFGGIDIESNIISSGFSTPKFYDNNVEVIDSSIITAKNIKKQLEKKGILNTNKIPTYNFIVSNLTESFSESAALFFKEKIILTENDIWK